LAGAHQRVALSRRAARPPSRYTRLRLFAAIHVAFTAAVDGVSSTTLRALAARAARHGARGVTRHAPLKSNTKSWLSFAVTTLNLLRRASGRWERARECCHPPPSVPAREAPRACASRGWPQLL
jgi:hypothetical protein